MVYVGYTTDKKRRCSKSVKKEDVFYIVSILVGNSIIKVVADEEEIKGLNEGDRVVIASKAFNPFILSQDS